VSLGPKVYEIEVSMFFLIFSYCFLNGSEEVEAAFFFFLALISVDLLGGIEDLLIDPGYY